MALDPSISLQGTMTNPNALVQAQNIAESQQSMRQSRELQPGRVKQQKQQISGDELSLMKQKNDMAIQLLGTVVDQSSYDKAKATAMAQGLDVSRFPDVYDPQVVQQAKFGVISNAQALSAQMQRLGIQADLARATGDPGLIRQAAENAGLMGSSAPAQNMQNTQDPLAEFDAARDQFEAQNGVSPASKNPPSLSTSNIPVKDPYEGTSAYNARIKAAGDVDTLKIMDAAKAEGKPITYTQAVAIKNGKMSAFQDGEMSPLKGALETKAAEIENEKSAEMNTEFKIKALQALPKLEGQAQYMNKLLEGLKTSPGREYATGMSSVLPIPPGTPAADFMARYNQVGGRQFLEAFETLKGGGQITEIEGTKATEAIGRMSRAQTEEEFLNAVNEFQEIVNLGLERARNNAGVKSPASASNNGWTVKRVK